MATEKELLEALDKLIETTTALNNSYQSTLENIKQVIVIVNNMIGRIK